jgi:alcohol dehydrogenase (NADP+)
MEVHPYLQQKDFNKWLTSKGIHVIQFSPLGNQNAFYRNIHWSKEDSHIQRVIEHPTIVEIAKKHGKTPVQVTLAWGLNSGRSIIPKSVIDWQVKQNIESDFPLDQEDMAKIAEMDIKTRFNDPSEYYRWPLYSDLEGAGRASE